MQSTHILKNLVSVGLKAGQIKHDLREPGLATDRDRLGRKVRDLNLQLARELLGRTGQVANEHCLGLIGLDNATHGLDHWLVGLDDRVGVGIRRIVQNESGGRGHNRSGPLTRALALQRIAVHHAELDWHAAQVPNAHGSFSHLIVDLQTAENKDKTINSQNIEVHKSQITNFFLQILNLEKVFVFLRKNFLRQSFYTIRTLSKHRVCSFKLKLKIQLKFL